jgi:mannose-6-phosphate isomerase-like protein (cupin superfamily)
MAANVRDVSRQLQAAGGGYTVVHESAGLETGVYVLLAPEPDRQTPHRFDEVYIVLEGEGTIEIEGTRTRLREGDHVFVAAEADHRFVDYERLVLLVVFNGPHTASKQPAG